MINSLQSFRGIFALFVLLSHYTIPSIGQRAFYPGGASGVVYFLILSGFVMCASYASKITAKDFNYRKYIAKRFIRVMPLNWLALLGAVVLAWMLETPPELRLSLLNTFALQAWWPFGGDYYGINVPSWCLAPILLFYLLFPFIYKMLKGAPKLFISIYALLVAALLIGYKFLPNDFYWVVWTVRVFPPFRLVEFTIGMILYELYVILDKSQFTDRLLRLPYAGKTAIEVVAILIWIGFVRLFPRLDTRWLSSVMWWIPTTLLFITFALLDRDGGFFTRVLHRRPLIYLGEVSFCIYLTHWVCFSFLSACLTHFKLVLPDSLHLTLYLIFCVIIGILVYEFFDKPLSRALRKKLVEKKSS